MLYSVELDQMLQSGSTLFDQSCLYKYLTANAVKMGHERNLIITKTRLFKYIETFTSKNWKSSDTKILIFFMSAQNID